MLTLRVISNQASSLGALAAKEFDSIGGTFGRGQSNDWVLPDPEKFLSGTHAKVFEQSGVWYLQDVSTNGTFINSTDARVGNGNQVALNEGDQLILGDYIISVSVSASPAAIADPFQTQSLTDVSSTQGLASITDPSAMGSLDPLDALNSTGTNDPFSGHHDRSDPLFESGLSSGSSLNDNFVPSGFSAVDDPGSVAIPDDWDQTGFAATSDPESVASPSAGGGFDAGSSAIPDDWDQTGFAHSDPMPQPAKPLASPHSPPIAQPTADPFTAASGQAAQPAGQGAVPDNFRMPPPAQPPIAPHPEAAPTPAATVGATMAPTAQVHGQVGGDDVLSPILSQLGINPGQLNAQQRQALANNIGTLLSLFAKGMREVLAARSSLKSEFRIAVTTIKHTDNNPLKFSMNDQEALRRLLLPTEAGYMPTDRAVLEAFNDLKAHQVGLLAGLRASFDLMTKEFAPTNLERKFDGKSKGGLSIGSKKVKYWDSYHVFYSQRLGSSDDNFRTYFGDAFVEAYDRQMQIMNNR